MRARMIESDNNQPESRTSIFVGPFGGDTHAATRVAKTIEVRRNRSCRITERLISGGDRRYGHSEKIKVAARIPRAAFPAKPG